MVVRVMNQAQKADVGRVIVACCSEEISSLIRSHGGEAVLTDPDLPSGTDRVWATVTQLNLKPEIIINLQGDLPNIQPEVLRDVSRPLKNKGFDISTVAAKITNNEEVENKSVVKIAMGPMPHQESEGEQNLFNALYFSRSAIPANATTHYHHIGVYAYRYDALKRFVTSPPSYLETTEKLEQLRALGLGMKIGVQLVDQIPQAVDTLEDLDMARKILCFGQNT